MAKHLARQSWRTLVVGAFMLAAIALLSAPVHAKPATAAIRLVDLTKAGIRGLPPSLEVTLYRGPTATGKRPLVVFVPQFGAHIGEAAYRRQAQYFVDAGYVVAVPHLTGLYNDGIELPVYDPRLDSDFVEDTTPFAVEVLATVAALSAADGEARTTHVILGVGLGSVIAARYGSPSVWIHAKGNKRITDAKAADLFASFSSGGAPAQLVVLPDIGMDGDAFFTREGAPDAWEEPVSKFLRALDFN